MLPYNNIPAVEDVFGRFGDEIACVITEASAGNMGTVAPLPGYNAALRRITAEHGALLISDEVMTGFRVSRSGWYGIDPVDADLFTFGTGESSLTAGSGDQKLMPQDIVEGLDRRCIGRDLAKLSGHLSHQISAHRISRKEYRRESVA